MAMDCGRIVLGLSEPATRVRARIAEGVLNRYKMHMSTGFSREQAEQLVNTSRPAAGYRLISPMLTLGLLIVFALLTFGRVQTPANSWVVAAMAWIMIGGMIVSRWTRAR